VWRFGSNPHEAAVSVCAAPPNPVDDAESRWRDSGRDEQLDRILPYLCFPMGATRSDFRFNRNVLHRTNQLVPNISTGFLKQSLYNYSNKEHGKRHLQKIE
jgi:hypothetical protein